MLDFGAFDAWYEEDEEVTGHAREPLALPVQGQRDVRVGRRPDLGWCYEQPRPEAVAVAGLVACWDERVDVIVDGERRPRPGGPISAALRDEFGV